jgi:hypothetical protein
MVQPLFSRILCRTAYSRTIAGRALLVGVAILFAGFANAIAVSVTVTHHAVCAYGGRIQGSIQGGIPDYTVELSTGQLAISSFGEFVFEDVPAGSHTVTVVDALSDVALADVEIMAYTSFGSHFAFPLPSCSGGSAASVVFNSQGIYPGQGYGSIPGIAPLSFDAPSTTILQDFPSCWVGEYFVEFIGSPGAEPTMGYVDANGCPGTLSTFIPFATELPDVVILDLTGSCTNVGTGSVTVATWGGAMYESKVLLNVYRADGTLYYPVCGGVGPSLYTTEFEHTFTGLSAGNYFLRLQASHVSFTTGNWNDVAWPSDCTTDVPFTVPDQGPCALVAGRAYLDNNQNCVFNPASEQGVPNAVIQAVPGFHVTTTLSDGSYSLALPSNAAYALTFAHPAVEEHCVNAPIPVNGLLGTTTTLNIGTLPTVPLDVGLSMQSGAARPGFQLTQGIQVRNLTPASGGTTTLTLTYDPTLSYLSATPTPTSVNGNVLTWVQGLPGWVVRDFAVQFQVPPDVGLLGTELTMQGSITTTVTDGNQSNNVAVNSITVTGSYDPNDKLAVTSSGNTEHWIIGTDQWIDYTVRFQNTGTDTAFHVVIRDTLPSNLDASTLVMGAASHPYKWRLDGQGVLKVFFANIQLPDSNVNEPRSNGFVSFRIQPRGLLQPGDEIRNEAGIYFDFNPPVITDPSILTVPSTPLLISPRVYLGGAFNSGNGSMDDGLRSQDLIPLLEPYTALGYGPDGAGAVASEVLEVTGNGAIVDWVLIELRSPTAAATVISTRAALVQRDGDVVDVDGDSPLAFDVQAGPYFVALVHRNHLAVMSAAPLTLSTTTTTFDLTDPATSTYGTNARANVNGTMVLWPGDSDNNGTIRYTGLNNDRDPILQAVGGVTPTNVVSNIYSPLDVNMDGSIRYTGSNNDRDIILQSIGGIVPTATRTQQLP